MNSAMIDPLWSSNWLNAILMHFPGKGLPTAHRSRSATPFQKASERRARTVQKVKRRIDNGLYFFIQKRKLLRYAPDISAMKMAPDGFIPYSTSHTAVHGQYNYQSHSIAIPPGRAADRCAPAQAIPIGLPFLSSFSLLTIETRAERFNALVHHILSRP